MLHMGGQGMSRIIIAVFLQLIAQKASTECSSTANHAGCTTPHGVGVFAPMERQPNADYADKLDGDALVPPPSSHSHSLTAISRKTCHGFTRILSGKIYI
jgi:hypothetical protein